jgi:hypothetical protein
MLMPQPNAILSDLESPLPSPPVLVPPDDGLELVGDDFGELDEASEDSEVD